MATLTSAVANKSTKPARSMTHPLRARKNSDDRRRKGESQQFDPDELRRKLEAHVADQKLRAEKRRSKTNREKQTAYHHIPKVAAADFTRTATPELMGQKENKKIHAHKLAQAALRHRVDDGMLLVTSSFDLRQTQALDNARRQRDIIGDRNQFQRTRDMEEAAQVDRERNVNKVPQRTFGTDHLEIHQKALNCRPLSTGDINWDQDIDMNDPVFHTKPKSKTLYLPTMNDRQDWAQQEDASNSVHRSMKDRVSPFLRKPDSKWILRSRKVPKLVDPLSAMDPVASSSETKNKKNVFLGIFKR